MSDGECILPEDLSYKIVLLLFSFFEFYDSEETIFKKSKYFNFISILGFSIKNQFFFLIFKKFSFFIFNVQIFTKLSLFFFTFYAILQLRRRLSN